MLTRTGGKTSRQSRTTLVSMGHTLDDVGLHLEMIQTHDRKVASLNPGRSNGRIFFSRVNFVCWLLFGVLSTPVLQQWHLKDPGHSATSAGGRLHQNTHTPLTQQSWSGLTMLLCRHSVETYLKASSHATCQGISATVVSACWATVD